MGRMFRLSVRNGSWAKTAAPAFSPITTTLLLVALFLNGCKQSTDLSAVRALQKAADEAQVSYAALATDYYDSCQRRVEYESVASSLAWYVAAYSDDRSIRARAGFKAPPRSVEGLDTIAVERVRDMPLRDLAAQLNNADLTLYPRSEIIAILGRSDLPQIIANLRPTQRTALDARIKSESTPESAIRACSKRKMAAEQWRRANDVLIGYFNALGSLAGAPRAGDVYGMQRLAGNLEASEVMNDAQAKAVAMLGTDVLGAIFDAKRRNVLADEIPRADSSLKGAVDALQVAAKTHYQFALRQESDELEAFLSDNFILARPGADAFQVLQYGSTWAEKRKELDDRHAAADAYVSSLAKLRKGHTDMLRAIDQNNAEAAFGIGKSLYEEMKPDIEALRKAFGGKGS